MTHQEVETLARETKQTVGGTVAVVGMWIWVEFETMPDQDKRQWLKDHHFHWNSKRKVWQYAGKPSTSSPADSWYLICKYGSQEIEELVPA